MREIENAGTGGERDVVGVLVDSVKEDRSHGVARGNRLNGPATVGGYRVVPMSHPLHTLMLRLTNGRVGGTHGTVESPTSAGMDLRNQRRVL